MSDTITASRVEPTVDPRPAPNLRDGPEGAVAPGVTYAPPATSYLGSAVPRPEDTGTPPSSLPDQLARLEDKTARIEEKLARSEAATQRVVDRFEAASHRMSEVAQQSDLVATRNEVKLVGRRLRSVPGVAAILLASVVTAILTIALMIAIMRFFPGVLRP